MKDGIFSDFTGADGTSIWAAATSGSGAISVHLLACMLLLPQSLQISSRDEHLLTLL
jgi:hypothetical protein